MKTLDYIEKAWNYIKANGYVKNETADYIEEHFDELEEVDYATVEHFIKWLENKISSQSSEYYTSVWIFIRGTKPLDQRWQFNTIYSAMGIYFKELKAQEARDNSKSTYVGNVGDKIRFTVKEMKDLSYSQFGATFWRIVGTDDNVYMWSTGTYFNEGDTIEAKVKAHNDYKGEKQTVVTRGKIVE